MRGIGLEMLRISKKTLAYAKWHGSDLSDDGGMVTKSLHLSEQRLTKSCQMHRTLIVRDCEFKVVREFKRTEFKVNIPVVMRPVFKTVAK